MKYEGIHEAYKGLEEEVRALYNTMLTATPIDLEVITRLMQGAIDDHVHPGPDHKARRWYNDCELAIQACEIGMGGIVLKCHSGPSTRSAALAQWAVNQWAREHNKKSIKVVGGVALDYHVGGLNPEAVRVNAQMGGRFVWTPHLDSSHQRRIMTGQPDAGGIEVVKGDKVVPELEEIFKIIVEYDLVLCICHHTTRERYIMVDAALEAGVKRIELVHVFQPSVKLTIPQMKEFAKKGVYMSHMAATLVPPEFPLDESVKAIKEVGADHFVLGTDGGNYKLPPPAEAYRTMVGLLLERGISEADLEKMARINAERLIF